MATPVHFVLDAFESEITLDLSGTLPGQEIPQFDFSGQAIINVSIQDMSNCFMFQTDSDDVLDPSGTDLKFFVRKATFPQINPADAMMHYITHVPADNKSMYEIGSGIGANGPLPNNKRLLCHDFVRYLAVKLFNTHFGVDLFNNEKALLQNIRLKCGNDTVGYTLYDINAVLDNVEISNNTNGLLLTLNDVYGSTGVNWKFSTIDDTSDDNICRVLFYQIAKNAPERFRTMVANHGQPQGLPFVAQDSISFKLTIRPAENQHLLTNPTAGTSELDQIPGYVYKVKYVIVADAPANVENTAVTFSGEVANLVGGLDPEELVV